MTGTETKTQFYAHTKSGPSGETLPQSEWEPLFTKDCGTLRGESCEKCEALDSKHGHLNKVAYLAGKFAEEMFEPGSEDAKTAKEWGRLAGLWHDLGKFLEAFMNKLMGEDISLEHAGAGAVFAKLIFTESMRDDTSYYPLAAVIAGHHSGLSNYRDQGSGKLSALLKRLKNNEPLDLDWSEDDSKRLGNVSIPCLHEWCRIEPGSRKVNLSLPFYCRQLLSCLVDADSLVTEALGVETKLYRDYEYDSIEELQIRFDQKLDAFPSSESDPRTERINRYRKVILSNCRNASNQGSGVFSLNVPTGGGKTLSGMSFALRHAMYNGQRRIIVVAPYTTIIEQTADEYRKILGERNVIEHHSNLDDFSDSESIDEKTHKKQLAAENWDAPVIVTTTVQLFESLFANKRARCRKIHNIANSVIIIDEAQCLPISMLDPTLFALKELVSHYACSLVLSTATQPAFRWRPKFPHGFGSIVPILSEELTLELHQEITRRRINIDWKLGERLDSLSVSQLIARSPARQKLVVVNSRREAAEIFEGLKRQENPPKRLFHLSTNLCPAHRRQRFKGIKCLLKADKCCVVSSTQLIECGVDHSYQCVLRSLAGIDSLAQSAGRCNRSGENPEGGEFIVYESDSEPSGFLANCARMAGIVLGENPPEHLANLDLYQRYFEGLYQSGAGRDTAEVLHSYGELNLEDVAKRYKLIEDYKEYAVIIPWGGEGQSRLDNVLSALGSGQSLSRRFLRSLQPYTVNLSLRDFEIVRPYSEPLLDGGFSHFVHPRNLEQIYDSDLGLKLHSSTQSYLGCHG